MSARYNSNPSLALRARIRGRRFGHAHLRVAGGVEFSPSIGHDGNSPHLTQRKEDALDPLLILGIGIATVLGMILILRVNAFLALITAAMLVGILAGRVPMEEKISKVAEAGRRRCALFSCHGRHRRFERIRRDVRSV